MTEHGLSTYADFNMGWLFALEDHVKMSAPDYDDKDWRQLDLPHDWSIEFAPDKEKGDGATAYLLGGIGWYRKHFSIKPNNDQLVFVLFDGIYNNSEIWLNGKRLGENPYGYSPLWFDLTPHLAAGGEQVLAVRVDHHRYVDSRWYTGSGIYRNVKLVTKSRLHIPIWGTQLTTPDVTQEKAWVQVAITVINAFDQAREGALQTRFVDAEGTELAYASTAFSLAAGAEEIYTQWVEIDSPQLWDVDTHDGQGITWGLCHFTSAGGKENRHSILARFDCDLSPRFDDPAMRETEHFWTPDVYFRSGLSEASRELREQAAKEDLGKA